MFDLFPVISLPLWQVAILVWLLVGLGMVAAIWGDGNRARLTAAMALGLLFLGPAFLAAEVFFRIQAYRRHRPFR